MYELLGPTPNTSEFSPRPTRPPLKLRSVHVYRMFYLCAARGGSGRHFARGENSNNKSVSGGESARSVVVRTKTDFGYVKIDIRQCNVLVNVVRKADFYRGETLDSSGCRVAAALPHPPPTHSIPYLSAA